MMPYRPIYHSKETLHETIAYEIIFDDSQHKCIASSTISPVRQLHRIDIKQTSANIQLAQLTDNNDAGV